MYSNTIPPHFFILCHWIFHFLPLDISYHPAHFFILCHWIFHCTSGAFFIPCHWMFHTIPPQFFIPCHWILHLWCIFHYFARPISLLFHSSPSTFFHWLHLLGAWCIIRRVVTWPNSKNRKKKKVVALYCSFPNLFELCSKVLLLGEYEVKDSSHCWLFFCFLCFSPWKQLQTKWFQHIEKAKRRGYNHHTMGNLTKKGRCIP